MAMLKYDEPRQARVKEQVFQQKAAFLIGMGMKKPEQFWIIGEKDGNFVIHPDDLSSSHEEPFTLRKDIVEFLPES